MTKDEYLKLLKIELEKNQVEDVDLIIEKFNKRFDIANEADMTIEETIAILGDPQTAAEKYLNKNKNNHKKYNLKINDSIIENLKITTNDSNIIEVNVSEDLINRLEIKHSENSLTITDKQTKRFFSETIGDLEIIIGKNIEFDDFILELVSTDVEVENINAKNVKIKVITGDVDIEKIIADNCSISTISGDYEINYLKANTLIASTISGDIDVNYINVDDAKFSTISGDISAKGKINKQNGISVSGEINIKEFE